MRDTIRLTFRMHRFELIAIGIATIVLVAAAYVVAARLNAVGYGPCADRSASQIVDCEARGRAFFGIQEREVTPILGFMALLPYAAGLFLGAPLIAREIERGTTRLAWSIAPSRFRWYLARMLPVVVAVLGLTFVTGVAVDQLIAARSPGIDIANSFDEFGKRGVLVAITALVMTAGAVGLGSVIGRVLPTIILALILGSLGLAMVARVHERFTANEAIAVDETNIGPGDRYVDQFFQLPDGRLVGWQELAEIDPAVMQSVDGPMSKYPIVNLVIPGERYRSIEAREALALGGIAVVMLAGTAVIVQRRRPG